MGKPIRYTLSAEDGITIPGKWCICAKCQGKGTQAHPAFSNGITSEEWHSPDWDEESKERYLSGGYDIPCTVCNGRGSVIVPDVKYCSKEERRMLAEHQRAEAEYQSADNSERWLRYHESGGM